MRITLDIDCIKVKVAPDDDTAAVIAQILGTVTAINERMFTMAAADDLRREVQETKDIAGKVDAAVQLIADLKPALADAVANNTGLTAAEVADLAAQLDTAQVAIAGEGGKLDTAKAP
jgi:hypothetical protein